MNLLKTCLLSLLSLFIISFSAKAQTEYFVEINPADGTFKKINSFPFVKWINPACVAYDAKNHKYYFCGSSDKIDTYLYTIDAHNGNILDSAAFLRFNKPRSNLFNLQYGPENDKIYAIHWDDNLQKEFFITVEPHSGTINIIKEIPGVYYVSVSSMLDEARNEYIFQVYDIILGHKLYFMDLTTGDVLKQESVAQNMTKFYYNPYDDKIYAMAVSADSLHRLLRLNRNTLAVEASYPLPGVNTQYLGSVNYAYNAKENIFSVVTRDTSKSNDRLTNINTQTGQIISSSPFPYVSGVGENVICFSYDTSWNKLFAVHWEPVTDLPGPEKASIYPNPFSDYINFEFRKTYQKVDIFIYDITNKYIGKQTFSNTRKAVVDRTYLASGIYFAHVILDNVYYDAVKIHAR